MGTKAFKIAIWDTAGQEKYSALAKFYYQGAKAAIIVFDVSQPESFERAKNWVRELLENVQGVVIALVANKIDMPHEEAIMVV